MVQIAKIAFPKLIIASLFFTISGCSTISMMEQTSESVPVKPSIAESSPSEVIISSVPEQSVSTHQTDSAETLPTSDSITQSNTAVVALLDSAHSQQQQGDLYAAQTSIQRAQRISPRDPAVYYALAGIHRDLNDYELAEQVALKGVSIVPDQPTQLHRFWLLISDIRQRSGDARGAQKALEIARRYQ